MRPTRRIFGGQIIRTSFEVRKEKITGKEIAECNTMNQTGSEEGGDVCSSMTAAVTKTVFWTEGSIKSK